MARWRVKEIRVEVEAKGVGVTTPSTGRDVNHGRRQAVTTDEGDSQMTDHKGKGVEPGGNQCGNLTDAKPGVAGVALIAAIASVCGW